MGGFRKLIGGEEVTGSREMIMGSTMEVTESVRRLQGSVRR